MMKPSLVLALILSAGCAHVQAASGPPTPVVIAPGVLTVQADSAEDAGAQARVVLAARAALPALLRFGRPGTPVTILVLPSHEALEEAIHRPSFRWLRAWARYDVVYLQSPRTWGLFAGGEGQLTEMLTHELTHCAMFQAAGLPDNWTQKGIPLWFREGMASWAAGQEGRRWSRARLATELRDRPGIDPILQSEALYRSEPSLVYSTAHWAFVGLLDRVGTKGIEALLADMKAGGSFRTAFAQALGLSVELFERELLVELRGEGTLRHRSAAPILNSWERAAADGWRWGFWDARSEGRRPAGRRS